MENYISYETAKEIFGSDFEENETVAYDTGNEEGTNHPIKANCLDAEENLWWFSCDTYDYDYSEDELRDRTIVTVA